MIAVETSLSRRDLGIGALLVVIPCRAFLVVPIDRLIADQRVDRGIGSGEILEFDRGIELAVAGLDVLGRLRHYAGERLACLFGPPKVQERIAIGLVDEGGERPICTQRFCLLGGLRHAQAIAQGHDPVETDPATQGRLVRRNGRQQRIEAREGRIGALEAPRGVGRPDLRAPSHHGAGFRGGNRRCRPGDHRRPIGSAKIAEYARRFVAHTGIGRRQPDGLAIDFHGHEGLAGPAVGIGLRQQTLEWRRPRCTGLFQYLECLGGLAGVTQYQRQQQRPYRLCRKTSHAFARQDGGIIVEANIPVGARGRQQCVVRRIGPGGLLEHSNGLSRLTVLLEQGHEIHRDQAVIDAGRKQSAKVGLSGRHLAGAGLQHRCFATLGGRLAHDQPGAREKKRQG